MATIQVAIANIKKRGEKLIRGTIIGTASRIIRRTPIDEGTLRGNWQPSINQAINTQISRKDTTGAAVGADISREGQRLTIGDVFYMSNNLPYAARIEFDGWSRLQAPQGMMRIEVLETAAAIRANRAT